MSKLIMCPICDEILIDDELPNNQCPHCGFSFSDEENVEKAYRIYICPTCGDGLTKHVSQQNKYICKYCNTPMIRTDINMSQYMELCVYDKINAKENTKNLANKYGNNRFSDEEYHHRIYLEEKESKRLKEKQRSQSQPTNTPTSQVTCPYCQSTNTKKITAGDRVKSNILFGIFAKNRNKEWHCNSCNSDF